MVAKKGKNVTVASSEDPIDPKFMAMMKIIQKKHGEGSIYLGNTMKVGCDVISTGSMAVDVALGIGGIPRGRITEIYGPESSGKTTLALSIVAQAQKLGLTCAYIDAENALDPTWCAKIGIDLDRLFITQPDTGEQGLDIVEILSESGNVDLIIVDSVAALVPATEISGEMGDAHVGLQARMMASALRKISSKLKDNNVALVFINQLRDKIGSFGFGPKEGTPGGRALKFYASVRLDVRRTGSIKKGEDNIGNTIKVTVSKNKLSAPYKEAKTVIDFLRGGISLVSEIVDYGLTIDAITKSGAFYSYKDTKIQGLESFKNHLVSNPNVCYELHTLICERYGFPIPPALEYGDVIKDITIETRESLDNFNEEEFDDSDDSDE